MLQYITSDSRQYSVDEQVQMVLEGGCRWIQISNPGAIDTDSMSRIIEMCREAGAFLTFEHDVTLCEKLRVHGVHLAPGDMAPLEARQQLGAHAVIGMSVTSAAEVIVLRKADIDYVQVGPFGSRYDTEFYRTLIGEVRAADILTPVVATGDIPAAMMPGLIAAGVNGFALSSTILNTEDPVRTVKDILNTLGV